MSSFIPQLKRWLPWCGFLVLAVAVVGTAWLFLKARRATIWSDAEQARKHGLPIPVRTVRVTPMQVQKVIGGTSLTGPSKRATIRINVSRTIQTLGGGSVAPSGIAVKRVLVKHGEAVHRGQILFELDDKDFVSSAKALEAVSAAAVKDVEYRETALESNKKIRALDVAKAAAEVKYRTVDLDTHMKIYDALEKLVKTGAAGLFNFYQACSKRSGADFALAVAKLDDLRVQASLTTGLLLDEYTLAQGVAQREQAAAAIELTRRSIEFCVVRSPLEGFVDRVTIVPGEVVDPSSPMADVLQLDPIWVCMDFPQERIGELSIGQQAEIVIDSFPRETFTGTVVAALPQVNVQTRTLPVYIEVSNPGGRIRAGVSGFSRISVTPSTVIVVPATAVIQDQSRAMVFRIENGRARIRQVVSGHVVENGRWEILEGLSPGDEIVIFGNKDLRDGDVVDTDWRTWSRRK